MVVMMVPVFIFNSFLRGPAVGQIGRHINVGRLQFLLNEIKWQFELQVVRFMVS